MSRWTKESAILGGRALAAILRRTPTARDLSNADRVVCPSACTAQHLFGSISAFQVAAGLLPNRRGDKPKRVCPNGHARTPDNLYVWRSRRRGRRGNPVEFTIRRCKVCHRNASLRTYRRRKAASLTVAS